MRIFSLIGIAIFFASCTYSVNLVHTEGTASDVVDETQTPSNSIPVTVSR